MDKLNECVSNECVSNEYVDKKKKKKKKKKNRCQFKDCNKKLKITALKCVCDKKFCDLHRLKHKHNCAVVTNINKDELMKKNGLGGGKFSQLEVI